jgi:hypothetical protein
MKLSLDPDILGRCFIRNLAKHRGYIYLLIAAFLFGIVVRRNGDDSSFVAATGKTFHQAKMLTSQMAIEWGFADPPPKNAASEPEARVWVDFPSGTYYCHDSRRYGKTSNGQFTTESNARLSQYEPSLHKPCK